MDMSYHYLILFNGYIPLTFPVMFPPLFLCASRKTCLFSLLFDNLLVEKGHNYQKKKVQGSAFVISAMSWYYFAESVLIRFAVFVSDLIQQVIRAFIYFNRLIFTYDMIHVNINQHSSQQEAPGLCWDHTINCSLSKDSIFIYFNMCISFFEDILFIYAFLFSNSFFFYAAPVSSIIFCIMLIPISLMLHCSLTAEI